jgi:transcriptional regulator with XRE-family HTH domain
MGHQFTEADMEKARRGRGFLSRDSKGQYKLPKSKSLPSASQNGLLGKRIRRLPVTRTSLPQILRDLRLKANLSTRIAAKLAGLGKRSVETYESGKAFNEAKGPGILRIERLVRACGGTLIVEYDSHAPKFSKTHHGGFQAGDLSDPAGRDLESTVDTDS